MYHDHVTLHQVFFLIVGQLVIVVSSLYREIPLRIKISDDYRHLVAQGRDLVIDIDSMSRNTLLEHWYHDIAMNMRHVIIVSTKELEYLNDVDAAVDLSEADVISSLSLIINSTWRRLHTLGLMEPNSQLLTKAVTMIDDEAFISLMLIIMSHNHPGRARDLIILRYSTISGSVVESNRCIMGHAAAYLAMLQHKYLNVIGGDIKTKERSTLELLIEETRILIGTLLQSETSNKSINSYHVCTIANKSHVRPLDNVLFGEDHQYVLRLLEMSHRQCRDGVDDAHSVLLIQ